jgi:hypothetical protein
VERYLPENKDVIDSILLKIPGVKGGKAFGYPAYKVNGKVFAFVGGEGVAIKLSERRVIELLSTGLDFAPFEVVDGIIWKSWLAIDPQKPEDFAQFEALFLESFQFVAENS